jgi:hypothetical protein
MASTFIYALTDPRNSHVRYIGKADDPERRLVDHFREVANGHNRNPYFCWWIKLLQGLNLKPVIRIIMTVPKDEWRKWERHWIWAFRWAGEKITNLHEGGTGGDTRSGYKHSEETKARMRAAALANIDNRIRAGGMGSAGKGWMKGKRHSKQTLIKFRAAAKIRPRDPITGQWISRQT